jgi:hypothetical protein
MKTKTIIVIPFGILVLIAVFWYLGAQPSIVTVGSDSALLRTAQAVDFTVQHPYSWTREFVSIPQMVDDKTVIPQGISEDEPFMILYPAGETKKIRILFSVNDLSLSGITINEYSQIVEEFMGEYEEFNLTNKESKEGVYYYEYSYSSNNEKLIEIKKFSSKNEKLLTVVGTFDSDLSENYYNLVKQIIETSNLR